MSEPGPSGFFQSLGDYLELGIGRIEGWLSPTTASMIARLLVRQSLDGLRGDVCEIGVHHGKFFLVLANATLRGERAVAVDIFGNFEKNLDQSGAGDRALFEHHVAAYAPAVEVEIIQQSSLDLERMGFFSRRFRFISIDGGHTARVVGNDLRLAEHTLLPGGIAALDDILSHDWTGVLSGLACHLAAGGTLVPFALMPNKLLLAADAATAEAGRASLLREFPLALSKRNLEFLGGAVDSYVEHPYYSRETQAGLRREVEDLRRSHAALHAELAASRAQVAALRASTSWRLTAPMRALAAWSGKRP